MDGKWSDWRDDDSPTRKIVRLDLCSEETNFKKSSRVQYKGFEKKGDLQD